MEKMRKRTIVFSPAQIVACSLVIGLLEIDKSLKFFSRQLGLMYLGEACGLYWDTRQTTGECAPLARLQLQALLEKFQLSFGLDPVASGWVAPYWRDNDWNASIGRIVSSVPNIPHWIKEEYVVDNSATIGRLLQNLSFATPTTRRHLQSAIGTKCFAFFRAGMVMPKGWNPEKVFSNIDASSMSEKEKLLRRSIGEIGLPVRVVNALTAGRIMTIGEVVNYTASHLHRLKGFGRISLYALKTRLSELGLILANERLQAQS